MKIDHSKERTWVEVDTKALAHNYSIFRGLLAPQCKLMCVCKSNAYGHGFFDYTALMDKLGVDSFGVDSITEALQLRDRGIQKPILILGYTLPTRLREAIEQDISITVSTFEALKELERFHFTTKKFKVHLKIDSGMHRQGFEDKDVDNVVDYIKSRLPQVEIAGIYTHFAAAGDPSNPTCHEYTLKQIETFKNAVKMVQEAGFSPLRHAAATAGTLNYPEAHFDMVRVGIGLMGLWPSEETKELFLSCHPRAGEAMARGSINSQEPLLADSHRSLPRTTIRGGNDREEGWNNTVLLPALSWKTVISEIKSLPKGEKIGYDITETLERDSRIAILPIGYWHGIPRSLSSRGEFLVHGKRVKILGRVSMDMTVIDVTDVPDVQVGDIATAIGKDGTHEMSTEEIAKSAGTINYEFVTRINPQIVRYYIKSSLAG